MPRVVSRNVKASLQPVDGRARLVHEARDVVQPEEGDEVVGRRRTGGRATSICGELAHRRALGEGVAEGVVEREVEQRVDPGVDAVEAVRARPGRRRPARGRRRTSRRPRVSCGYSRLIAAIQSRQKRARHVGQRVLADAVDAAHARPTRACSG